MSRNRHPLLRAIFAVMTCGLVFEAVTAVAGGHALATFGETWVYTAIELGAVGACAARVGRPTDRLAWTLMTAGMVAWTAGDLIWTVWLDHVANPPYPSVADGVYLLMYPSMYVALMLLIRGRLRSASIAQWLDGGVIGLAGAGLAAALLLPRTLSGGGTSTAAEAVNLGYACGDLMLLVLVAVAWSLSDWRPERGWRLVGLGFTVLAAADIIFCIDSAAGTYTAGPLLDVLWPAAMALLAWAAWAPAPRRAVTDVEAPQTIVLTILAAVVALGLLIVAAFDRMTAVGVVLAAAALVVGTVRATMAYVENTRMLRLSELAATIDPLSGLGNRRALMADLERVFTEPAAGVGMRTLAFFDLNGFKRYNDSFGHAAGDALLARIGAALSVAVSGYGRAYRLGGDEFCALLDGRRSLDDGVVQAAGGALVEHGTMFTIAAAVGVAVIPDEATTASAALRLADERMYSHKSRTHRAQARDVLMQVLSERTPGLHAHVTGVSELVLAVARALGLDAEAADEVLRAAELHDIGKLAIPDAILDKPGPLDETEWVFMREHPVIGERILSAAPALAPVATLVRSSHERWDGGGYPDGLAGEAIPLGARIVFACDAYDAMTADRSYQRARSREQAIAELRRSAGTQFDPHVVQALCAYLEAPPEGGPSEGDADAGRHRDAVRARP